MISFELSEEEILTRSAIQALAVDILRPAASAIDRSAHISKQILLPLWEAGIVQAILDSGNEAPRSRISSCIVLEELGWGDASVATCIGTTMAYVQALVDFGTQDQISRVKTAFSTSEPRAAAVLIHEPGFARNISALQTIARKSSAGYVISGAKAYVPFYEECRDWLVVAQCEDGPQAFLLDAQSAGVELRPDPGMLGLKGLSLATLHLDQLKVPHTAKLGGPAGCDTSRLLASARVGSSTILTGLARAVFEHITAYTKERVVHGSALARKQSVAFRLADMFIDIPSMRWMCWKGAAQLARNQDAKRAARLAHIHCAERAMWIADEGVQLMGGHGYIRSNPVERWYRDARTLSLLEGLTGV
jgi:alkylation response protein AidB-like acyl-CoA dehydrogenase